MNLEPEEEDDEDDDDMGDAPAPAMAGKRATNVKPPEPPPKPSTQAGGKKQPDLLAGNDKLPRTTLTPTARKLLGLGSKEASPKAGVDKNALSARGSPKGGQSQAAQPDDPMGERGDSGDEGNAKKSRSEPCYQPWKAPMIKANRAPPPPDRHGQYAPAKDAGIEYGDPERLVWVRSNDRKVWEADANDGKHLGGYG